MKRLVLSLMLVTSMALTANMALAADEAQPPLLCAITEVIECNPLGECLVALPETVGLPDFIVVDLDKKLLLEATDAGVRSTKIDAISAVEGQVSFGGLETGRGWSAVLSNGHRALTATITDEQVGFVVFGACVAKP